MTTTTRITYNPARAAELRSQRDMGLRVAAREAGISHQALIEIEKGRATPKADMIARLASLYGVTPNVFFDVN